LKIYCSLITGTENINDRIEYNLVIIIIILLVCGCFVVELGMVTVVTPLHIYVKDVTLTLLATLQAY
jgi:TRAP-type C4-dicarboxylate transport system permease large subunit